MFRASTTETCTKVLYLRFYYTPLISIQEDVHFEYPIRLSSQQIRLLKLNHGREDTIHFSLHTRTLNNLPEYIALSYTWGNPDDTVSALCNGKTLNITRNLQDALWQLRESQETLIRRSIPRKGFTGPLYFWIDAVCINQNDTKEKNSQVKMMWDIYSRACLVVAWLGRQNQDSKSGLDLLHKVAMVAEYDMNTRDSSLKGLQDTRIPSFTAMGEFGLPNFCVKKWNPLFHILTQSWFTRVWIIQELVASKACVFLYGSDTIDASTLLRVGHAFDKNKFLSSLRNLDQNKHQAVNIASLASLKWTENKPDLLELLWSTHLFQATNPRDRVFALLNMAYDLDSQDISSLVDYRLHPHEVLKKTARLVIHKKMLEALPYAQACGDLYSLPSWAANWTASDYSYIPLIRSLPMAQPQDPVEGAKQLLRIEENDVLVLEAKVFDFIRKLVELPQAHVYDQRLTDMKQDPWLTHKTMNTKADDTRNLLRFHQDCWAEIRKMNHYPTGEDLPSLYWRAYFLDDKLELPDEMGHLFSENLGIMEVDMKILNQLSQLPTIYPWDRFHIIPSLVSITTWSLTKAIWKTTFPPNYIERISRLFLSIFVTFLVGLCIKNLSKILIINRTLRHARRSLQFLNKNLETLTTAHNKLTGRNFCITDAGHVGWVSRFAKEGDGVCVFRGSPTPFVIRRVGLCHNGTYRLRGDCYIHGLMGENLFMEAKAAKESVKLV
ncbi:HET-domain-containing protein [Periconia macrospinosa]|uniref:HET-domain-containing protein n=1 Tax=Periconia macrospinosa TaxID=97972 RepID=A0A2V1D347_9PLEO|nr:HET-domain-containing protein [Periconia macrospinosa]